LAEAAHPWSRATHDVRLRSRRAEGSRAGIAKSFSRGFVPDGAGLSVG
jgi:hypothetical protein